MKKRLLGVAMVVAVGLMFLIMATANQSKAYEVSTDTISSSEQSAQQGEGWTSVFVESFDSFPSGNWKVMDTAGLDITWAATAHDNDAVINPQSTKSAWPAAGGGNAVNPATGNYPNNQKSWMYYGPLDLSQAQSAEAWFSLKYDIEEGGGDWLGFCIGTNITDPANFNDCYWWQGSSDEWEDQVIPMDKYAGKSDVYIGWLFESDESNAANHAGPFIDEVEVLTSDQERKEPFDEDFVDWTQLYTGTFDGVDLANSPQWTLTTNQTGTTWVTTNSKNDSDINPDSTHSASAVTPGNGYPRGLESWMIYGPVDLSNYVEADVDFRVYYDLVFNDDDNENNDDWLAFCVGTSNDPSTFNFETCDWWTDSSQGFWEDAFIDLTPYAGQSEVYLAWYLDSNNGSANKEGAFVDEIGIWGLDASASIPDINFVSNGLLIQNGSFDNNLQNWSTQNVGSGSGSVVTTQIETNTVASMSGDQYLYQAFDVATDTVDLLVSYDYTISTSETKHGKDQYCLGLTMNNDPSHILVDLGCFDPVDVPQTERDGKQLYNFKVSLNQAEVSEVKGKNVALAFELAQDRGGSGTGTTIVSLDNITIYATGKTGRNPASVLSSRSPQEDGTADQRDQNEPNDAIDEAMSISCGQTVTGVFGDVGGGDADSDWFKVSRVPTGQFVLDIEARSKRPASTADTYLRLYDSPDNQISDNDDDEQTLDSWLVHTNMTENATYYVLVENLTESGAEAFYDLKVECQENAPSPNDNNNPPTPQTQGNQKAWTMILYLNGEDQKCIENNWPKDQCWDETYKDSIKGIEKYINEKKQFLNVVVLLDGPNYYNEASDVTRYVVQPNGNYTEGSNKWTLDEINMGDPRTFVDFVKWAQTNYPAKNYYLSIDDHGNGIYGTSTDHHDAKGNKVDDTLTPAELRSAMKEITQGGKQRIQIFDYESCLMGMAENAYDLKDFVEYVAFFQSISFTSVNYPKYFEELKATDDALTVGKRVIQKYPVSDTRRPYTFTLVDSSKMTAVREKVDAFATALMSADLNQINEARNQSQAFNGEPEKGDASKANDGYIDLWDLADQVAAKRIAESEAAEVKKAVEAAVVDKKAVPFGTVKVNDQDVTWDYRNYHGLSIYYPTTPPGYVPKKLNDYCSKYQMSKEGKWDDFLTGKVFVPPPGYSWNCSATTTSAQQRLAFQGGRTGLLNAPAILEPRPLVPEDPTAVEHFLYLPAITR